MSRYFIVPSESFNDKDGNTFPVKPFREIPVEPVSLELPIIQGTLLDEVATRETVYGEFGEGEVFRIFDANVIKLAEADFDLTKLKALKVPL